MKLFTHGLIVGKFMPLHNGHLYLVDTALQQSKCVTICLMSRSDEPIPGDIRLSWLEEVFKNKPVTILHHTAELPQDSSGYGHWDDYLTSLLAVCTDTYDAIFSSELYGERLAKDINVTHVMIDHTRSHVPVTGREIREHPSRYQHMVPSVVNEYYATK